MLKLHATRKLFDRLPVNNQGQLPVTPRSQWLFDRASSETGPLDNWHGNLVNLQRRNCLLLVHGATRFPLVLPSLTKPDFRELNDRFVDTFMNTLLKCGAEDLQLEAAHQQIGVLSVDTYHDRSSQATLSRMKEEIEHLLWHDNANISDLSGYRLGAWLADTPRSIRGRYLWPKQEMLKLLGELARTPAQTKASGHSGTLPDNVVSMDDFRHR